jgi:hydroxymethylbilane synthase
MKKYLVGTRASRLAIAQTEIALSGLKTATSLEFEVITISTRGDTDKRPLFTIDEKGIFEKEVNEAVMSGQVDFAVHSLKDIPSDLSDKLTVASIPKRASPNDVLVSKGNLKLSDLPRYSTVGTSSLRRAIQVLRLRPDLRVKPIRGNVETRISRTVDGDYDASVLAEAGLTRLGMEDVIAERFDVVDFLPAPGQGALAFVCRADNKGLVKMLRTAEDPRSKIETDAERALVARLESGCRFPVAAVAVCKRLQNTFMLYASIFSSDGSKHIRVKKRGNPLYPSVAGTELAQLLIKKGARILAEEWRGAVDKWNNEL